MSSGKEDNGIVVRGLAREFKGGIKAVDGIDLEVQPGEIYGFLGPNGAGKSTTVLMLTTLLPATSGHATVAGYDISKEGAAVRRSIGAALQAVALDNFLTGREHLKLVSRLHGLPTAIAKARSDELLERVGLTIAADRKVGGYSGGMRRRLDLALALVHEPRVLFLDEPTTGLDPQSRSALWEEVRRLADDDGVTVFLTTQYLEEADVLAGRVAIIDNGKIVAEGTPTELKAEYGTSTVEVTPVSSNDRDRIAEVLRSFGDVVPSTAAGTVEVSIDTNRAGVGLAPIVRALDDAGLEFANLANHAPSLDDVFIAKTGRRLEGQAEDEPTSIDANDPDAEQEPDAELAGAPS